MPTSALTVDRWSSNDYAAPQPRRIERLERRIADTRMTAALSVDWHQLHLRSRSFSEQITETREPAEQIAIARQIRAMLLQREDTLGLRALRLATAGPMACWLQDRSARSNARTLGRDLAADQREALPELVRLEDQLALARGRLG